MRALSAACARLDVMTAFVSRDAVLATVAPAVERGVDVRFLTGTFGNVTRLATFRQLHRIGRSPNAQVRIWSCGAHRNLHAKLYVWWKKNGSATLWIGSANLTDGGLQNEGELVAELALRSDDASLRALTSAFEREWVRGEELSDRFLQAYREAPRATQFTGVTRRRRPAGGGTAPTGRNRMFVVTASVHHDDDSRVAKRVDALFGGTAEQWYEGHGRVLSRVRKGDWCLYLDAIDQDVGVALVTDVVRDGKSIAFAFEDLARRRRFTKRLRAALAELGLRRSKAGLVEQWVASEAQLAVVRVTHPSSSWR